MARRNQDFLMSVDGNALAGQGEPYAVSLTFGRDEIVSPDALRKVRQAFFERLRRMGLIRLHWLVEFQGDGTPHLHMLLYLPMPDQAGAIRSHWLDVAGWSGARASGQHVVSVNHLRGWKQYLGKHGIRGLSTIRDKCRLAGKSRAACGASWAIGRHGRLSLSAMTRPFSGCAVVSDPTALQRLERCCDLPRSGIERRRARVSLMPVIASAIQGKVDQPGRQCAALRNGCLRSCLFASCATLASIPARWCATGRTERNLCQGRGCRGSAPTIALALPRASHSVETRAMPFPSSLISPAS